MPKVDTDLSLPKQHPRVVGLRDPQADWTVTLPLPSDLPLQLGRSRDCWLPLTRDSQISFIHCELRVAHDRVTVYDRGSTNGTTVDNIPVPPQGAPLTPGALLQLGQTILIALGEGNIPIKARTITSLIAKSVPTYGSCRKAGAHLDRSHVTISAGFKRYHAPDAPDADNDE